MIFFHAREEKWRILFDNFILFRTLFFLDPVSDDLNDYNEDDGWEVMQVGEEQVCLKTDRLEDKCEAIQILGVYAENLGSKFLPFASGVLDLCLPFTGFPYYYPIREASLHTTKSLVKVFLSANLGKNKLVSREKKNKS